MSVNASSASLSARASAILSTGDLSSSKTTLASLTSVFRRFPTPFQEGDKLRELAENLHIVHDGGVSQFVQVLSIGMASSREVTDLLHRHVRDTAFR